MIMDWEPSEFLSGEQKLLLAILQRAHQDVADESYAYCNAPSIEPERWRGTMMSPQQDAIAWAESKDGPECWGSLAWICYYLDIRIEIGRDYVLAKRRDDGRKA